ncbi:methyltransferase domain-containing protein [Amycolatopsis sp. NBC_00345]|uniref:class I SAM-dependent methyltransferase n=1 Tax=Amycolatopsis sp. NBC_00345 TaxID=2975955 RepID=UPI002E27687B
MDTRRWDEMYRSRDRIFSGNPNGVLVAETVGLPPGQALDVGCGEGADALWLARHGWQVTAVDVSETALRRGAAATAAAATAAAAATDIAAAEIAAATDIKSRLAWARADLTVMPLPAASFDLVSIQYFPLRREPGHAVLRGLLNAVAPGGTLLFATHALADPAPRQGEDHRNDHGEGFDPADYYQPDTIAHLLDSTWNILTNETRPRVTPAPAGTHHTHDAVLRAQRLP